MDLNADLGEGFGVWRLGDDEAMLELVTSANVACGFHAGDAPTMRRVCQVAAARGVAIGAQVGYHDLAGFGRRRIDVDADELGAEVLYQLGALDAFARAAHARVRYVKPHGALYHAAAEDEGTARALVGAVAAFDPALAVLGLPLSALAQAAQRAGVPFAAEAFADRAYLSGGGLVPRGQPGAVLTDPATVSARAVGIARDGRVTAVDGSTLDVRAASLCVHGDTPGAVRLAHAVRAALGEAGVTLAPFTS
ncbi:MAG: LamB/YcsF family protein [Jatrophihabitantaceae bacterium]